MKTVVQVVALAALTAGMSFAGFIQVDPTRSYGTPVSGTAGSAVWIAISGTGAGTLNLGTVNAGDQISLQATGDLCYQSCTSGSSQINVNSLTQPPILAGFSATSGSTTFLFPSGGTACNTAGASVGNCVTGTHDWTNDFNDFQITAAGVTVTVPNGANYIVFSFRDSLYTDNLDKDNNFGVNVALVTVPEPTTYTMLLGGLGILFGIKRFRRS